MASKAEILEIAISKVVYRGKGLARTDGLVVFVRDVLPGETVRVEIAKRHKNFAEARLLEVLEPAPARVRPACPLAVGTPACVGCCYQHAAYDEELRIKQMQLCNFLERSTGADVGLCDPPVAAPNALGYRSKIVLHAALTKKGGSLGYFTEDNRSILDVPRCPLAVEPLSELVKSLRSRRRFVDSLRTGEAVTLRHTDTDGALHWEGKPAANAEPLTETFFHGTFRVPRQSFFQVNLRVAELIAAHVAQLIARSEESCVVDLCCGVGVFAVAAAEAGVSRVLGIDVDDAAVSAARENARERGLSGVEFATADAQEGIREALAACAPERTLVVLDPPRRGLERTVIERICGAKPSSLVYVACAVDTMARDLKSLTEAGYRVVGARLFDMFPRTPYFESVVHLEAPRGKG